jgi:hypothetical protein
MEAESLYFCPYKAADHGGFFSCSGSSGDFSKTHFLRIAKIQGFKAELDIGKIKTGFAEVRLANLSDYSWTIF